MSLADSVATLVLSEGQEEFKIKNKKREERGKHTQRFAQSTTRDTDPHIYLWSRIRFQMTLSNPFGVHNVHISYHDQTNEAECKAQAENTPQRKN